jgi:Phosphate-starvation-inducible E family
MAAQGRASLGDILLLFIYLEIGAMVGIYFKTTHLPVRYLIYIANGARTHADRNCRRRAPDRHGYTGYNGRNSPAVVRRLGPKIRVLQISFRTADSRLSEIKAHAPPKRRLIALVSSPWQGAVDEAARFIGIEKSPVKSALLLA